MFKQNLSWIQAGETYAVGESAPDLTKPLNRCLSELQENCLELQSDIAGLLASDSPIHIRVWEPGFSTTDQNPVVIGSDYLGYRGITAQDFTVDPVTDTLNVHWTGPFRVWDSHHVDATEAQEGISRLRQADLQAFAAPSAIQNLTRDRELIPSSVFRYTQNPRYSPVSPWYMRNNEADVLPLFTEPYTNVCLYIRPDGSATGALADPLSDPKAHGNSFQTLEQAAAVIPHGATCDILVTNQITITTDVVFESCSVRIGYVDAAASTLDVAGSRSKIIREDGIDAQIIVRNGSLELTGTTIVWGSSPAALRNQALFRLESSNLVFARGNPLDPNKPFPEPNDRSVVLAPLDGASALICPVGNSQFSVQDQAAVAQSAEAVAYTLSAENMSVGAHLTLDGYYNGLGAVVEPSCGYSDINLVFTPRGNLLTSVLQGVAIPAIYSLDLFDNSGTASIPTTDFVCPDLSIQTIRVIGMMPVVFGQGSSIVPGQTSQGASVPCFILILDGDTTSNMAEITAVTIRGQVLTRPYPLTASIYSSPYTYANGFTMSTDPAQTITAGLRLGDPFDAVDPSSVPSVSWPGEYYPEHDVTIYMVPHKIGRDWLAYKTFLDAGNDYQIEVNGETVGISPVPLIHEQTATLLYSGSTSSSVWDTMTNIPVPGLNVY